MSSRRRIDRTSRGSHSAALLLWTCCLACGDGTAAPSPAKPAVAVAVEPVVEAPLTPSVRVAGLVEALARLELPFRVTGVVARFHVEEGDRVEAGQLLADLDRERRAADAELRRARARSVLTLVVQPAAYLTLARWRPGRELPPAPRAA